MRLGRLRASHSHCVSVGPFVCFADECVGHLRCFRVRFVFRFPVLVIITIVLLNPLSRPFHFDRLFSRACFLFV